MGLAEGIPEVGPHPHRSRKVVGLAGRSGVEMAVPLKTLVTLRSLSEL